MRIVIISDTHGKHSELPQLRGNLLIHCGDLCDGEQISPADLERVDHWFGTLEFDKIIAIGGNHDFVAQAKQRQQETVLQNATYLVDQALEFGNLKIYGTPWIPALVGWAYHMADHERKKMWEQIPDDTDLLITHTPPFGILDKPRSGKPVGCPFLQSRVAEVKPAIHCFGHIHASYGIEVYEETTFINASVVDSDLEVNNAPKTIELDPSIPGKPSSVSS